MQYTMEDLMNSMDLEEKKQKCLEKKSLKEIIDKRIILEKKYTDKTIFLIKKSYVFNKELPTNYLKQYNSISPKMYLDLTGETSLEIEEDIKYYEKLSKIIHNNESKRNNVELILFKYLKKEFLIKENRQNFRTYKFINNIFDDNIKIFENNLLLMSNNNKTATPKNIKFIKKNLLEHTKLSKKLHYDANKQIQKALKNK